MIVAPLLFILAAALVYHVIYNRYFHPLSSFPGPFWATVSRLWLGKFAFTGDEYKVFLKLHEKYGPIFRITPTYLIVSDAKAIPVIYHRDNPKDDSYLAAAGTKELSVIFLLDNKSHTTAVKKIKTGFTMTSIRKAEPLIDERIDAWISALKTRFANPGKTCDMANWTSFLAYDAIFQVAFGEPFGFVNQGKDVDGLIAAIQGMSVQVAFMARLYPFFVWIRKTGVMDQMMHATMEYTPIGSACRFRDASINRRLKEMEDGITDRRQDILQSLLDWRDDAGNGHDMEYIKAEILFLTFAGGDTTGFSMQDVIMRTFKHPEIYERVMQEISDADRNGHFNAGVPQYDQVAQHCPYYVSLIKEVLRLDHPVPAHFARVVPEGGMTICGRHVPAGTEIGINPRVAHRDKSLYGPDAEEFKPERWLDAERAGEYNRYSYAFGYGSRTCLGQHIASMELYKAPLQFFRTFRPRLDPEGKKPWINYKGSNAFWRDICVKLECRDAPQRA